MAVSIDGTETITIATGAIATVSQTKTVASNSNRALVALIANDNTLTVSGVAYTAGSGGTWTKLGAIVAGGGSRGLEIWSSIAPSSGTVTTQATFSGNIGALDGVMTVYSLFGVDQTTALDGYVSNGATSVASIAVTTTTGSLALAQLITNATPGAGKNGTTQDATNSNNELYFVGHNTGSGSLVTGWTTDPAGRGINACNVRAAASGFVAAFRKTLSRIGGKVGQRQVQG